MSNSAQVTPTMFPFEFWQRLDMEIIPARLVRLLHADFAALAVTACERRAYERAELIPAVLGEDVGGGVADDVGYLAAEQRIADRGEAQIAVLGKQRDVRAAQGDLVALEGATQFVAKPLLFVLERANARNVDGDAGNPVDRAVAAE